MIRPLLLAGLAAVLHASEHIERLHVRAYCPCILCCGINAKGILSTGGTCKRHPAGIAVDPARFPYGTRFAVPGYGTLPADDTGGDLRAGVGDIEVRFPDHKTALAWGVKTLDVIVITKD